MKDGGREEGRKGGREVGRKEGREKGRKGGREVGRKGGNSQEKLTTNKQTLRLVTLCYLVQSQERRISQHSCTPKRAIPGDRNGQSA